MADQCDSSVDALRQRFHELVVRMSEEELERACIEPPPYTVHVEPPWRLRDISTADISTADLSMAFDALGEAAEGATQAMNAFDMEYNSRFLGAYETDPHLMEARFGLPLATLELNAMQRRTGHPVPMKESFETMEHAFDEVFNGRT